MSVAYLFNAPAFLEQANQFLSTLICKSSVKT